MSPVLIHCFLWLMLASSPSLSGTSHSNSEKTRLSSSAIHLMNSCIPVCVAVPELTSTPTGDNFSNKGTGLHVQFLLPLVLQINSFPKMLRSALWMEVRHSQAPSVAWDGDSGQDQRPWEASFIPALRQLLAKREKLDLGVQSHRTPNIFPKQWLLASQRYEEGDR